jgi:NAD(P)-dependent dehydrogenase (short-subunit alcohol dehydrogenase family)
MSRKLSVSEFLQRHTSERAKSGAATDAIHYLLIEKLEADVAAATADLSHFASAPAEQRVEPGATIFVLFSGASAKSPVILGRRNDAEIQIDDPNVSRDQLRFDWNSRSRVLSVVEMGSHNGSKLDGRALAKDSPQPIREGEVLEIAGRYRAAVLSEAALVARLRPRAGLLASKVAIVTGGGRGLGRAYAQRLASEGCRVVVNDVGAAPDGTGFDSTVAAETVAEVERAGGIAIASCHDVSRRGEAEALFDMAEERFGEIDILVCSAGALHVGSSVLEMQDQAWDRMMATNATGTFVCLQTAARRMVKRGRGGRIITTSSLTAMAGSVCCSGYAASKAAVYALSKTAALELEPYGITVNTLTPMAWTRLTCGIPAIASIPYAAEVLSPEYVADVVLFLASDLSAGITGHVVDVGGPQIALHNMLQTAPSRPESSRWTPQELQRRWGAITGEVVQD